MLPTVFSILGVDPGDTTGWAVLGAEVSDGTLTQLTLVGADARPAPTPVEIWHFLSQLQAPAVLAIERPGSVFGALRVWRQFVQWETVGLALSCSTVTVSPRRWQREVLGRTDFATGTERRSETRVRVRDQFGRDFDSPHVCDAISVAVWYATVTWGSGRYAPKYGKPTEAVDVRTCDVLRRLGVATASDVRKAGGLNLSGVYVTRVLTRLVESGRVVRHRAVIRGAMRTVYSLSPATPPA